MKRIRAKTKNKSKPKKAKAKKAFIAKRKREKRQGVRSLRGKYKHLDLMKGLVDARKEERKSERIHSKTKKTKSRANGRHVVKEAAPIYRVLHQHDLFETEESNGQRLGYSPAYGKPAFTAFRSVTPETNLSSLNLNWREVDLPEKERTKHVHRLHPYLGKFIPQLVEIFLRKFRPKSVYDPFAG